MLKVIKHVGGVRYSRGPMDFNWCDDGELLVLIGIVCYSAACGCRWSFTGLDSRKGTTRGVVVELAATREEYAKQIYSSNLFKAWKSLELDDARAVGSHTLDLVRNLEIGTVIGAVAPDRVFVIEKTS